ncbi:MAG: polysaccharide biosynthesis/export family protein [Deltaproteobacteria bacterium]|nr:polysaccharide biosynthesis/export family protein [Deltaproteobacteria bacterium]
MKKVKLWIMLLISVSLISISIFATASLAKEEKVNFFGDDYLIGRGDILDISVWKDEALTKLVTVLPDGKISFPLIGDIDAAGKTVTSLRNELNKKIEQYVPDPNLSVVVQQVNSMMIYIIGRINHPGRFVLNTNINVLQALSMAGGLNPFAKKNKILIFREENGKTTIFKFRYNDVSRGEALEQNIILKRGDIIVVP